MHLLSGFDANRAALSGRDDETPAAEEADDPDARSAYPRSATSSRLALCALIIATALILATFSVTPAAERISAQDGGTTNTPTTDPDDSETTPATTGELVVVPSEVQKGQTTLAVGFHVVPFDLQVEIHYSGHFTPEGESCDNAGTAGSAQAAAAPTWITLNACTVGDGYVRMVESATAKVIKNVSVTVIQPGVIGQQARTTVTISGLASTELEPGGSGDGFSVSVAGLEGHKEYNLHTVVLNSLSAAFNRGCTSFKVSDSIVGLTSTTASHTVYGCVAPGNYVWSYVEVVSGRTLVATGPTDNPANVADPKVSFEKSSYDVDEQSEVTITVKFSHPSSHSITVPIQAAASSAVEGEDYEFLDLTSDDELNFQYPSDSKDFRVAALDDDDFDDEILNLKFGTLPDTVMGSESPKSTRIDIDDDDENSKPFITTRTSTPVEFDECGGGTVERYSATDPDGHPISWRLQSDSSYPDRRAFDIDDDDLSDDGILKFDDPPDFENPVDTDRDNVYKTMIQARDGHGGSDLRNVTVRVTNRAPSISSRPSTVSYAEGGTGSAASYNASDPCGGDIKWSLPITDSKPDGGFFSITGGSLRFKSPPDYENPVDDDQDNEYEIKVTASDGELTASRDVTVEVTNRPPTITSGDDKVDYAENGTDEVEDYNASDPGGGDISWSLPFTPHAVDRALFKITRDGELNFKSPPDFENPQNSDNPPPNKYKVTIRASDASGNAADLNVTVTVTDVNEPPSVDSPIADQTITGGVSRIISLQGRFSDPDGDTLSYSASSSVTGVATANVSGDDLTIAAKTAGSTTITVTAADRASGHADRLTISDSFTVTVDSIAPAKVTGLTGTPGSVSGTIILDWDPADRADNYEVEQRRRRFQVLPFEHWVLLDTSEVTIDLVNTNAIVSGLTGGETYRHRVRGIRGTGSARVEGEWSDEVETTLALPEKVTGLTGMAGTNHGEIDLQWDEDDDATGYQVRQSESGKDWTMLSPRPGSGFSITDATAVVGKLDPDETYRYQVRGTNLHGEGEWSVATAMITPRDERPNIPQDLKAKNMIGLRGFMLEWQAATGAAGYEVLITPSSNSHQIDYSGETAEVTGLTPDTHYAFRVRASKTYQGSSLPSAWSDPVRRDAPRPSSIGHQEDHTVAYKVRSLTTDPGLPVGFPDPAAVIRAAIEPAAEAWNQAAAQLNKALTICALSSCAGSNHDGWTVTVKTVSVNTKDSGDTDGSNHGVGCGRSVACVKAYVADDHLRDMSLIIEEPAWECRNFNENTGNCGEHAQIYWTDVSMHHEAKISGLPSGSPPSYLYYMIPTMTHEFGHTLGLHDFYNDPKMDHLDAVMNSFDEIQREDEKQLEAIYAYHDSASH